MAVSVSTRSRQEPDFRYAGHLQLSVGGILAVVGGIKVRRRSFFAPNLLPSSLGMVYEVAISIVEVAIDRVSGGTHRWVVAAMDDRSGHTAENRFDNVQELR